MPGDETPTNADYRVKSQGGKPVQTAVGGDAEARP